MVVKLDMTDVKSVQKIVSLENSSQFFTSGGSPTWKRLGIEWCFILKKKNGKTETRFFRADGLVVPTAHVNNVYKLLEG